MLIPMIIPIVYGIKYKRNSLLEICIITFTMVFIVVAYWPLTLGLQSSANIVTKFLLFVLMPLAFLYITWKIQKKQGYSFKRFGITEEGFEKSLKLGLLFLPIMLLVTFIVKYMIGGTLDGDFSLGVVSFVES